MTKSRLSTALGLAFAFVVPTPAGADIGAQSFNDGVPHTVTDNIVAPGVTGLEAIGTGTVLNMAGHSINATWGAEASGDGRINLVNVAVTASGGSGLFSGGTSVLTMTGGSIVSSGGGGNAGAVVAGGTMILNGVTIRSSEGDQYGALTNGAGTISIVGGAITTSGADSYGLMTNGGGTIAMVGGSVTTTGARAHAVWGGNITLTNVAVTASGTDSYALYGRGNTIDATVDAQTISGAGALMYADMGSTVNLTATGSGRLYGITAMNGGGIANLALGGNAVWTVPGDSVLATLALNGGTVAFTAPSGGYKTLGVAGTLSGSGGTFILNADLPAGQGDFVSINGAASGRHHVFVLGRRTPADLYQAIKVLDLREAAINTATFSGGGDIGAYRYAIADGAAVPVGYNGVGSPIDVYLYNTFAPSTPASAAVSTSASPGVLWYGEMNDIKKRLGELRLGGPTDNVWARTHAGKYVIKPRGGFSFDQNSRGLEVGGDKRSVIDDGQRYIGWVAGVARADNSFAAGGSGVSDSFYLGAYGSWLQDDGYYLDIVAKHNWFRHSFNAPLLGGGSDSAAYNSRGFGFSVETGRRIERADGIFVEPQVELAALRSPGKDYVTANGLHVVAPDTKSLQVRLGAALGRKTRVDGGSRQVYGKLSWVEELAGQSRTTVDMASFDSGLKGGRMVVGLGIMEDTDTRQVYVDVETAKGKNASKPWGFNLGCRWKF